MKQRLLLQFARLGSFLSLFGILLCIHMTYTLARFVPPDANVLGAVYIFIFVGVILGALLCPLFLPLPGEKNKRPETGIGFIAFLTALECVFRFLGLDLWLNSAAVRSVMAIPEGMLITMSFGLFYMTWLRKPQQTAAVKAAGTNANRTGRWCSFVFGTALLISVLVGYYSVPLMQRGIAAAQPLAGVAFAFNFIKWCMLGVGAAAALSVFFLWKLPPRPKADIFVAEAAPPLSGEDEPSKPEWQKNIIVKGWPLIFRLVSLTAVFTILNGLLNSNMFPLYSDKAIYHPHFLTAALVVPILGLLAGRSIDRFIRWLLPPTIVFFIMLSCLPLFEEHPLFNTFMSTIVAIAQYTIWVVFTTAVVEHYSGRFWFYGIAIFVFFTDIFTFLTPLVVPDMPDDAEYRVLFIIIAAVVFMLLAFRLIFPKQPQPSIIRPSLQREPFPAAASLENIFRDFGLSQREIEVANLLVNEGFGKKEIAECLYIAEGTAKLHISNIYQKFLVNSRAEFMALFVNRENAAAQDEAEKT